MQNSNYDIAIMGGGLAGLTLARQLLMQQPERRVAVIEKRSFPVSEAAHKVGESTVEIGAHYFAEVLKMKKHLLDEQLPKFGLRFFLNQFGDSMTEATEVGGSEFFPAPSYQIDRGRFENDLAESVAAMGADLLGACRISQVELGGDIKGNSQETVAHRLTVVRDRQESLITCRWLVDASGRAALLRRKLDLSYDLGHEINAVWFRLNAEIRIDQWCEDPEWQSRSGKLQRRWLSTNHLLGPGYWVWLIPLATGATSIGIVTDPRLHPLREMNRFEKAMTWLHEHEPVCAQNLEQHRGELMDFLAVKRIAYGCRQVFSADRWALTGEAGVFLDPFYSPGSDYIAIANTMICKLIEEDEAGRPLDHLAPTLQSIYLTLFQNNLLTYKDLYPLFGNPRIMSLKILWDYAVYWTFPALLYFNDKLTDAAFIQSISLGIEEMREMNRRIQQFFRDWHEVDDAPLTEPVYLDQRQIDFLFQLNGELKEMLDDAALRTRFARNVDVMRDLMVEIITRVRRSQPQLEDIVADQTVGEYRLDGVFETLSL